MLIVFFSWMVMAGMSFIAGHFALCLIEKLSGLVLPRSFALITLLGCSMLSITCAWISLICGINSLVFSLISLTLFTWLIINYGEITSLIKMALRKYSLMGGDWKGVFYLALLIGLLYSAAPSKCYDEGLYYIQTIRWNTYFPVVPGLGNLECRLAANSSWHLLAALFSFPFIRSINFDDLNGFLFLIVIFYAFSGIAKILKGSYSLSTFLKAFLILPNFLFYFSIMGPAADLAVTYYTWIIFVLFVEKIEQNTLRTLDGHFFLILVFSVFLITVKLSAFTTIPLILYLGIISLPRAGLKKIIFPKLLSIFIIAPWLIRNVILSGYLIFPMNSLDLFHVDWKIPADAAIHLQCAVEGWAKIAHQDCESVIKMSLSQWFPIWFASHRIYDKLIFIWLVVSLLAAGLLCIIGLIRKKTSVIGYSVLYLTLAGSILLWFFKSPDFRFGYGQILFLCAGTFGIVFRERLSSISSKLAGKVLLISGVPSLLIMLGFLFTIEGNGSSISNNIFLPAPLPVPKVQHEVVNSALIDVPIGEPQCWGNPIPCSLHDPLKSLHLRTKRLEDGFRIEEK